MPYNAQHALEHPESAGWALGALDPDDAAAFGDHLRFCEQCQAEVAGFAPVAQSLTLAAPANEPPPDLESKILAAVQYAVMAASQKRPEPAAPAPNSPGKASRWWRLHWTNPLLTAVTALGAAAVTAIAFIAIQLSGHTTPPVAASFHLRAQPGQSGSATATARHASGGWEIQLTVKGLTKLGPGQFYECWYATPANRPGHPELITAGTFTGRNGTFTMWTAADTDEYKVMQITAEQPGNASQHGKVILSGTAQTS
jgi:Anti-sigma-K factor rskA, C-terminal